MGPRPPWLHRRRGTADTAASAKGREGGVEGRDPARGAAASPGGVARTVGDHVAHEGGPRRRGATTAIFLANWALLRVRTALGASARRVVGLVLKESLLMTATGVAAGLLLARPLHDLLESRLAPGVGPSDPATWVAATAILLLVTVLASLQPPVSAWSTRSSRHWRCARIRIPAPRSTGRPGAESAGPS